MKKIIFILLIGFLIYSCNNEQKLEVINADLSGYVSMGEFYRNAGKNDSPAVPAENSHGDKQVRNELLKKLKAADGYAELLFDSKEQNYSYSLLVGETGTVDKLIINKSMGKDLDQIVIDEVSGWKFKPAVINGANIKFIYDLQFNGTDYFVSAEQMPEPVGGIQAISKLVHYPELAKKAGIQGRVFIRAFLNETGNVDSAEVIKGIGAGCDEAALDAVKQSKFIPAKENGQNIKVQVTVPILFKLQ